MIGSQRENYKNKKKYTTILKYYLKPTIQSKISIVLFLLHKELINASYTLLFVITY